MPKIDKPLKGTLLFLAIETLQDHKHGHFISEVALAEMSGHSAKDLARRLVSGLKNGWLERFEMSGTHYWRIGSVSVDLHADIREQEEAEADARLQSANMHPSVFAYAADRGAAPFSCNLGTDGRLKIERYGRLIAELTNGERIKLLASAVKVEAPLAA